MSDFRDAVVAAWQVGGSGRQWQPSELSRELPAEPLWLHLDRAAPGLEAWLQAVAQVPEAEIYAELDRVSVADLVDGNTDLKSLLSMA